MRFARPTLAIASPVFTFALVAGLLTAAFSAVAQPARATYTATTESVCGTATALAPKGASSTATYTTLADHANLSEFYALIERAGLRSRLNRPTESLTVFAPTNDAMATINPRVRERMNSVGAPVLKSVVRAHIVPMLLTDDQLTDGREIETIGGQKLRVARQADGTVLLDGVYRLRDSGQRTTNGIIYTLDHVITPR